MEGGNKWKNGHKKREGGRGEGIFIEEEEENSRKEENY